MTAIQTKAADVVIVGGAVMGSSVAYHLLADPGFQRTRGGDREGPDLPALRLRALGGLDPAAIFERREHPDLALRNPVPAQHRRHSGGRRRAARDRSERGRLSLLRERGGRTDPAREPRPADDGGRRYPAPRPVRPEGPLSLAEHRGPRGRHLGPDGRGMVRRLGPAAGLPQKGPRARRRIREGRGRRDRARRGHDRRPSA